MIGLRFWRNLMAVPMFLGLVVIVGGCGGGGGGTGGAGTTKPKEGGGSSSTKAATKSDKTALAAATTGTLKGKVTLEGEAPKPRDLKVDMEKQKDKDHCLKMDPKNDLRDPLWIVSPNKEVKNVVVWLRPPEGKYFDVPDAQKQRTDTVTMDQPFCMFIPHVVSINPSYFDGKQLVATGQKFEIKNSSPRGHNTKWTAQNSVANPGDNKLLPAGNKLDVNAVPGRGRDAIQEDLISISCDIHPWMGAKAWAFAHPYSVVTGDDGTFEIKNAPEGAELELCYWHESFGTKPKTEKITLAAGKPVEKNLTIKP